MIETDDRLAGDPVWELFPSVPVRTSPSRRFVALAEIIALTAGAWFLFPPLAIVLACLAVSFREFRSGWQTSLPDKSGGRICSLFAYAWGSWKLGATAFGMFFLSAIPETVQNGQSKDMPLSALTAMLLWMGGFFVAAIMTAIGLVLAYRSGMRVWIGEGINQARTLLLGMLLVGFTCLVLMPMCVLLSSSATRPAAGEENIWLFMVGFLFLVFGAPVILLIILDWFTRRIVAVGPGKFGPKVPTVGKWES